MQQTLQQLQPIIDGLAAGITDFFTSVIDGSKSAEEAFADMVKGLADKFLDMAAKILRDAITQQLMNLFTNLLGAFGGGGGGLNLDLIGKYMRADGGPVDNATPYIVGERGPELFVPNSSGTVLSTQDSKAAMASYSRMSPEDQKAADKGEDPMAVAAAATMPPIQMETRVINGVEYATVEQMEQASRQAAAEGAKQGAKIGEAQMLRRMRMNPATRKQIGI